jgi:hypothetical protein
VCSPCEFYFTVLYLFCVETSYYASQFLLGHAEGEPGICFTCAVLLVREALQAPARPAGVASAPAAASAAAPAFSALDFQACRTALW